MTYILEKYYTVNSNGKLEPKRFIHCVIRPCKWKYEDALKFMRGEMPEGTIMQFEGQIAHYDYDAGFSVEEWLVNLGVVRGITPDFEDIYINVYMNLNDYIVKTTDLHTNEVLYDKMDEVVDELKTRNHYH